MLQPMIQGGTVKSDTFSATSNSNGALVLFEDTTKKKILVGIDFGNSSANGYYFATSNSSKRQWHVRLVSSSNGAIVPVANTSVSGTYYYIETD